MKIQEFIKQVQNKEIDIVKHTERVLKETKKINKEYKCFNTISEDLALEQAKAIKHPERLPLAGLPISVKDCICVRNVESTAGSKILKGYKPTFNATVIDKLIEAGAIIIGKTSQDEFGFGGFSTNTGLDLETPLNPFDKKRATGGSSGGSAAITQLATFPHVSIAESTGGSIVNPASFCGVYGLCPTYGLVSRYGLIDYANSLDKIGPMTKYQEDLEPVLKTIQGHDPKDSTSLKESIKKDKSIKKIAVIKESLNVDKEVKDLILKKLENIDYKEISLPLNAKYAIPTYYLLATSEASTNLAKLSGMRYGQEDNPTKQSFSEYFTKIRSKNFGKEAKRRIIIGTFARMAGYRDAYYIKATKVRTMLIEEYKKTFQKYDLILNPTMSILPPKFEDIKKLTPLQNYMLDALTVPANLAGLPHISINAGSSKDKLPVGLMATANHLEENKLLEFSNI